MLSTICILYDTDQSGRQGRCSNYPARACAARGYVIGRGVYIYIVVVYCLDFFLEPIKNTHFERSILTQIGFSLNLMASGTA